MNIAAAVTKVKREVKGDEKFSILIPTWNNLPYLQLCINSIRKHSQFNHQLIVHVNEGTDGTLEWLANEAGISYTCSKENIGICYALNVARDLITTDYVLYMNDDMYVCPGWDTVLWKEIAAVGHNSFFFSSTVIDPVRSAPIMITRNYGTSIESFREGDLLQEYAGLPFNDWQGATSPPNIVHKDVWDLVGGYSIEFSPGMYSDPDFSMKLWKAGVRLFKGLSESRAYHFGSISLNRVKRNKGYYTFVAKWGITQNVFTKYFLRRGEVFNGPLAEPQLNKGHQVKNIFKQLKAAFYGDK
ncbi:glycosyltransferase family 2 protein [Foetidibacter luteolus]|uniref:glycosyltransferase family 2 protein n=1 Tax=Foetidibacter luteolus TaxID=2608880 RepID=UPI00129B8DCC|nr:glycosyltransferase family 2 protein [Foetidibacter luteolus]